MKLHESRPRISLSDEYIASDEPESIKCSLERIDEICTVFNAKIEQISVDVMSPFPSYGLIRAAMLRERLFRETGNYEHMVAADSLALMVRHFSRRWNHAGKIKFNLDIKAYKGQANCWILLSKIASHSDQS